MAPFEVEIAGVHRPEGDHGHAAAGSDQPVRIVRQAGKDDDRRHQRHGPGLHLRAVARHAGDDALHHFQMLDLVVRRGETAASTPPSFARGRGAPVTPTFRRGKNGGRGYALAFRAMRSR